MLLTLILNLGCAAGTAIIPPEPPTNNFIGGGGKVSTNYIDTRERIAIEDSELIAIVEICLKAAIF